MKGNRIVANNGSSIVLFMMEDGNTQLEVKLEKDTIIVYEVILKNNIRDEIIIT